MMSMQTMMAIMLASSDEEQAQAEQAHRDWLKQQPSDSEVLMNFLRDCEVIVPPTVVVHQENQL